MMAIDPLMQECFQTTLERLHLRSWTTNTPKTIERPQRLESYSVETSRRLFQQVGDCQIDQGANHRGLELFRSQLLMTLPDLVFRPSPEIDLLKLVEVMRPALKASSMSCVL